MNIKKNFQSHALTALLSIIVVLVLVTGAFSVGERVGFHKAAFAFHNGDNFYGTFGPNREPHMMPMMGPGADFPDAHGTAGKVIAVALPTITIEDKDNTEKTVVVSSQTIVRRFRDTLTPQQIAVGDYIVAIGDPNAQSQIAAALIRILPPLPQ